MRLTLIVAMAENRVIGREGALPWHISEDLKRFKRLTMGRPIIMGRKTWDSIGRPLPGRENIVITRNPSFEAEGAVVVGSLEDALRHARERGASEAFVIGGGEIFEMALPLAHRLELTLVRGDVEGDARFPKFDRRQWIEIAREEREQEDGLRYDFVTLEKAA